MVEKYYKREGRRFVQVELPQSPVITTNNAGKYYQSDGTFVNERNKDSIGLCIISTNAGHVIMTLEDCPGNYTHEEAIEEVKRYFNGKGEIPNMLELIIAFFAYKEKLNLTMFKPYISASINSTEAYAWLGRIHSYRGAYFTYAHVDYSDADAFGVPMKLRPIMRVK